MSDLVAWLWEQLDEDERVARETTEWTWVEGSLWFAGMTAPVKLGGREPVAEVDTRHMARHDPARVLREVESKRLQLDLHKHCQDSCYVVRVLAVPYADCRGYRDEWAVLP